MIDQCPIHKLETDEEYADDFRSEFKHKNKWQYDHDARRLIEMKTNNRVLNYKQILTNNDLLIWSKLELKIIKIV